MRLMHDIHTVLIDTKHLQSKHVSISIANQIVSFTKHMSISIANQIILITFKMPKLKHASSSLTTSRAKKWKKDIPKRLQQDSDSDENDVRQETDDVRQEMRRLQNKEARRTAHLDPLRTQQEQARNTEAR